MNTFNFLIGSFTLILIMFLIFEIVVDVYSIRERIFYNKIKIKITEKKNKKDDDDDDDLRAMSEGDSKDSNDGGDDDDDDDDDDVTTTAGADPTTTAAPTTTASPTTTTADNIGPIELGDSYVCTKNDNKYNCT